MYWITGLLGGLLVIFPFVFGLMNDPLAVGSGIVLGGLTLAMSIIGGAAHNESTWEYWVIGVLGILALVAPFVLSFTFVPDALWLTSAIGGALTALSGYKVFTHGYRRMPPSQQPGSA